MKITSRLLGGAAALAATARTVVDDGQGSSAQKNPDDENDPNEQEPDGDPDDGEPNDGKKKTGTAAGRASAGAAAPAGGAAEPNAPGPLAGVTSARTQEEQAHFDAGADSRNADFASVFSARAQDADGKDGELLVEGREQAAAELLAAGLSASATIKMLGKLPKGAPGDAMLENLRADAGKTPTLQPSGGATGGAEGKSVWDRVAAKKGWNDKTK